MESYLPRDMKRTLRHALWYNFYYLQNVVFDYGVEFRKKKVDKKRPVIQLQYIARQLDKRFKLHQRAIKVNETH